jgi:uncharacterized protein (TIGR01777 family)
MASFVHSSLIPAPASAVWRFHAAPGALQRLIPPWHRARVESSAGDLSNLRATIRLRRGPLTLRWHAEHDPSAYIEGAQFVDVQRAGPFGAWRHTHRVDPVDRTSCLLTDRVEYREPLGRAGTALLGASIRRDLERVFAWRHRRTASDVLRHARWADAPRRTVLISGMSGLIGSALAPYLLNAGHAVTRLARAGVAADQPLPPGLAGLPITTLTYDPATGELASRQLPPECVVVHLAGANVAAGRWTARRKRLILASRVESTRSIARALAEARQHDGAPRTLLCASGTHAYPGDDRDHDERSPRGEGFLAEVVRRWEEACAPAVEAGHRVVFMRLGMVVSARGGALARMLPPFRLGLGGRFGDGRQQVSWIALEDVLGAVEFLLHREDLAGPINLVAPAPVTNDRFTRALASALGRPRLLPAPAWALRAALGELGSLLLEHNRAVPARLLEAGFQWRHPDPEALLREELGRGPGPGPSA